MLHQQAYQPVTLHASLWKTVPLLYLTLQRPTAGTAAAAAAAVATAATAVTLAIYAAAAAAVLQCCQRL
jgi:hypothetical protein